MILQILHLILGLAFILLIPGYLLSIVLFKKLEHLERIAIAIGLSIGIDIALGLILGFNKTMASITGGVSELSVWIGLILVSAVLLAIYMLKKKS